MAINYLYPDYEVIRNMDRCIACRVCERQCANEVHRYDEELGKMVCDESKCVHCGKCLRVCPMNVEVNKESRKRKRGTECILCYECTKVCPTKALH